MWFAMAVRDSIFIVFFGGVELRFTVAVRNGLA